MAITLSTEVMIGVIVGSVFGGIVLLLLFGCIVYFACCRTRWKDGNNSKAPPVIREHRNGHGNPLYAAHPAKPSDRRSDPVMVDHMEAGKAIGYAYPIVGGRPVSVPFHSSASNPSSNGTRSSSPVKRTPSQLPPNAYRLTGLADKHVSMSDSNLSSVGTLNPAYDASDDVEIIRPVYRVQSLVQVSHTHTPDQHSMQAAYKLRTSSMERPVSKVYHYDGSLGRVATRDENESSSSSRDRHRNSEDGGSGFQVRLARELQPPRESDERPPDPRRFPPAPKGPPPRLPRVPLASKPPQESANAPGSPRKRSLTSELSYRAKGHIVTSEAFNFLDAFSDDPPKS